MTHDEEMITPLEQPLQRWCIGWSARELWRRAPLYTCLQSGPDRHNDHDGGHEDDRDKAEIPELHEDESQRRLLQALGWNAHQEPKCPKTTTMIAQDERLSSDEKSYPELPRDLTVGDVIDKTSAHRNVLAPLSISFQLNLDICNDIYMDCGYLIILPCRHAIHTAVVVSLCLLHSAPKIIAFLYIFIETKCLFN